LIFFAESTRVGRRLLFALIYLSQLAALSMGYSRTGFLAAAVGHISLFVLVGPRERRRIVLLLLTGVTLVAAVWFASYGIGGAAGLDRFINVGASTSDQLRLDSARFAWWAFSEAPLFGNGIATIYERGSQEILAVGPFRSASDPHCLYLLVLVEQGLLGLAILGTVGVSFMKHIRLTGESTGRLGVALLAGIVSLAVSALLSSSFAVTPRLGVVLGVLAGLLMSLRWTDVHRMSLQGYRQQVAASEMTGMLR